MDTDQVLHAGEVDLLLPVYGDAVAAFRHVAEVIGWHAANVLVDTIVSFICRNVEIQTVGYTFLHHRHCGGGQETRFQLICLGSTESDLLLRSMSYGMSGNYPTKTTLLYQCLL